jgi:hypothetical protein
MAETFRPALPALSLAVSTSSASVAVNPAVDVLRIYNDGPDIARIRWGVGAQTATTSDMAIPPNVISYFVKDRADTVAAITAFGSSTLSIVAGTLI